MVRNLRAPPGLDGRLRVEFATEHSGAGIRLLESGIQGGNRDQRSPASEGGKCDPGARHPKPGIRPLNPGVQGLEADRSIMERVIQLKRLLRAGLG